MIIPNRREEIRIIKQLLESRGIYPLGDGEYFIMRSLHIYLDDTLAEGINP